MHVVTEYAYGFIEGKYGTENDGCYIGKHWICYWRMAEKRTTP